MSEKKKLLYYDDEPFISYALAQNLQLFDWDVTLVSDINELYKEIMRTDERYDIVILDIMAPVPETHNNDFNITETEIEEMDEGMNTGIVLAKKIWTIENGKFSSLPILFLSARQQPEAINQFRCSQKKCDCLRKPELAKTIDAKLNELLNN